jgi:Glyoxalase-like domain
MLAFDHLVIAAASLSQGVFYVEQQLGVSLSPGGQHLFMGTHNALLRLGDNCYLEVIAIDPGLPAPARPRWFGLDDVALQGELTKSPRLIHWVARTTDIEAARAAAGEHVGPTVAASRGALSWKITIPDDGALPQGGAFPTLIEWPAGDHVARGMVDRGCSLVELVVQHREAGKIGRRLGMPDKPAVRFEDGETIRLSASIMTPSGVRIVS